MNRFAISFAVPWAAAGPRAWAQGWADFSQKEASVAWGPANRLMRSSVSCWKIGDPTSAPQRKTWPKARSDKSIHPETSCMAYLPAFTSEMTQVYPNVIKCYHTMHGASWTRLTVSFWAAILFVPAGLLLLNVRCVTTLGNVLILVWPAVRRRTCSSKKEKVSTIHGSLLNGEIRGCFPESSCQTGPQRVPNHKLTRMQSLVFHELGSHGHHSLWQAAIKHGSYVKANGGLTWCYGGC